MQEGSFDEIDTLGRTLSALLGCTVNWWGSVGKNVFVCKCSISFSGSRLKDSDDWTWAKRKHEENSKQ